MTSLRGLLLRLTLLSVITASLHGGTLTIAPRCVNTTDCTVSGVFTIEAANTPRRDVRIENGVARLAVDQNDVDVELRSPGFWMPPQHLTASGTQQVPVWRMAVFRGHVSVQRPGDLPKTLSVELQSPPGTTGPAVPGGTSVTCPVSNDGSWECHVPGAPLDIVLRSRTFVPKYLWAVDLKPNHSTDAGTLALKQGASFVAWLDRKTARSLKQPATGRLVRMTMSNSPTVGSRMNLPVAEGKFNQRGMLQLAAIPAGTYTLEVTAPGFAPTQFDKVPIYETRETILRFPIVLNPPLTIQFSILPTHDTTGSSWRVTVLRSEPPTFRHTLVAEATPSDGTLSIAGQRAGHYTIRVRDHSGNWFVNREFDIQTPADAQHTIDVALIRLRGKVVAGDQPLSAHIIFGGHSASVRVATDSDDAGRFSVVLPRGGKWTIEIASTQANVAAVVTKTIAVDQDDLEIALPDTEVAGWVKGPDGNRVAGAEVTCYTDDGTVSRQTSVDGTFRFRGASTGIARLTARDIRTGERSKMFDIPIANGGHRENIELQIENMRTAKGEVLAQGEPVVGARVMAYELGGTLVNAERAVTNLDGGFELHLDRFASQLTLVVAAAGRPLQTVSTTAADTIPAVELAPVGGELRLSIPNHGERLAVLYNGTLIPMGDLYEWARAQGSSLSGENLDIPNLAPGLYAFCVRTKGAQSCKDGTLAPSSVLTLSLE